MKNKEKIDIRTKGWKKLRALVVYYTRTGTTKRVAEEIAGALICDMEEIIDTKKRTGPIGSFSAIRDSNKKKLTTIKDIINDPTQYDQIIIGTPVWMYTMSTPIRAYTSMHSTKFNQVAFFCTHHGKIGKTFEDMARLCEKKPISSLEISKVDIKNGTDASKLRRFIDEIRQQ